MMMSDDDTINLARPYDDEQVIEPVGYDFGFSRRSFVQALGAGLLIAATASPSFALQQQEQRRRGGGGGRAPQPVELGARLHIGPDGVVTVMTGKVEGGQGSRTQITQAAAEELRVPPSQVRVVMADTALCPDDGMTVGSRTTPSTLPAVRQACAVARDLLESLSKERGGAKLTHADLASADQSAEWFKRVVPSDVKVTRV